MAIRAKENIIGAWSFLIGVILAIIIGVSTQWLPIPALTRYSAYIYAILVLLGVIVGFLNVRSRDSQTFMIAGIILVIVSQFGMDSVNRSLIGIGLGNLVATTFNALLVLFVPATIIVALKTVFNIAKV